MHIIVWVTGALRQGQGLRRLFPAALLALACGCNSAQESQSARPDTRARTGAAAGMQVGPASADESLHSYCKGKVTHVMVNPPNAGSVDVLMTLAKEDGSTLEGVGWISLCQMQVHEYCKGILSVAISSKLTGATTAIQQHTNVSMDGGDKCLYFTKNVSEILDAGTDIVGFGLYP